MKLKRVRVLPSVKLAGRVSDELNETLTAYADYYRDMHDEAIELWPLIAHPADLRGRRPRLSDVASADERSVDR